MAIHKLLDIVDVNLRKMPHLELGHFVVGLADAFGVHSGYQAPGSIPPPLPSVDELRQAGLKHIAVTKAAEGGDRYKAAERDALRPITELLATIMIQWAVTRTVRENDTYLVTGLGLPPKIETTKNTLPASVFAPQGVRVCHKESGSVTVRCDKVPKGRIYEVGICKGDPSSEESWSIRGPFDHCRGIELAGLEPGVVYYFRVRCFGAGVQSPWSAIVSLRVL